MRMYEVKWYDHERRCWIIRMFNAFDAVQAFSIAERMSGTTEYYLYEYTPKGE